jgi:ribonucleoside-triphosphate reductase
MTKSTMDIYQEMIAAKQYARWLPEEARREQWPETVKRYTKFWVDAGKIDAAEAELLANSIEQLEVMPSMRCMMTAGEALRRDNVAGFNCSYLAVESGGETLELEHDKLDTPMLVHVKEAVAFDELMYILMCGTGVGYSVEKQYVERLPTVGKPLNRRRYLPNNVNYPKVPKEEISTFNRKDNLVTVYDSKYGWASALRIVLFELYNGNFDVQWDTSGVRAAGEPLKTFGGRASGPEPLVEVFNFAKAMFSKADGRRLSDIEASDLCCKIAQSIVVGGVRRSALIGLTDLESLEMARSKNGEFWHASPQRSMANISATFTTKPSALTLHKFMGEVYESYSGERGIVNREAMQKVASRNGRRDPSYEFGTNPCSEIILRPNQFCNLSEVVVRSDDSLEELKEKVKKATILGTLQSSLTDFRYLRPVWKENTEEEALLGVSLTGIMDHPVLSGQCTDSPCGNYEGPQLSEWLNEMKEVAVETNKEWAERLGVNQSAAITCVKPSGTVSQLTNTASGIHPRFSPYYIRTVRGDKKDPMVQYMTSAGFPVEDCAMKPLETSVFSFPIKAPEGSICTAETGALEQLKIWKTYQDHWCEHKPSITVYYTDAEWFEVCAFIEKNWDIMSGISLLPLDDHVYTQAPYTAISEEEYLEAVSKMPKGFDWEAMAKFEGEHDSTTGSHELACAAGGCEI